MAFLYPDTGLPPFFMYPRFLLETDLSDTARLVYILLLDRARLSQTNPQWQDETGRVFVFYTITELGRGLGKTSVTVKTALRQLEEAGLILRRSQKQGTPSRIYVAFPEGTRKENCPGTRKENYPGTRKENYPGTRKENYPGTRKENFQNPVRKLSPNNNKRNNKKINNYIIKGLDYSYEEGESL